MLPTNELGVALPRHGAGPSAALPQTQKGHFSQYSSLPLKITNMADRMLLINLCLYQYPQKRTYAHLYPLKYTNDFNSFFLIFHLLHFYTLDRTSNLVRLQPLTYHVYPLTSYLPPTFR